MNCSLCDKQSNLSAIAVRVVDGELLDTSDFCRKHALGLALARGNFSLTVNPSHLGEFLDQCYREHCECVPENLHRCARCTRLADVWVTVGTDEDLDNLDRGILLCGPCAFIELDDGPIPAELRREMLSAVKRSRGDSLNL